LLAYDLQITHTKDKENGTADTLSRAPQYNSGSGKPNLQLLQVKSEVLVPARGAGLIVKNYPCVEEKKLSLKVFKVGKNYQHQDG
jgi:hypothetical protein